MEKLMQLAKERNDWKTAYHALLDESNRLNENGRILNKWIAEKGRGIDEVIVDMSYEIDDLLFLLRSLLDDAGASIFHVDENGLWSCRYCHTERGHVLDCPVNIAREKLNG